MYRDVVYLQDAIIAISMVESSMATSAVLDTKSVVRSLFPKDPESYCILSKKRWILRSNAFSWTSKDKEEEDIILKGIGLSTLIPTSSQAVDDFPDETTDAEDSQNFEILREKVRIQMEKKKENEKPMHVCEVQTSG